MGISRLVNTDFWIDETVIDQYSPEDKYFWLYLLTNPQTKQLGIYKLPKKLIAFQMGYSLDTVKVLIDRFQDKYGVIVYSEETQEVAILNYLKYSIVKGGKPVIDCILKDVSLIKNKDLVGYVYERVLGFNDDRDTMATIKDILSNYISPNDNDNDNDNDSIVPRVVPRVVKKFVKPTKLDIDEYCKESGHKVDAERFIDYYESKGWLIGKSPMKDWKASVRTWARNDKERTTKGSEVNIW